MPISEKKKTVFILGAGFSAPAFKFGQSGVLPALKLHTFEKKI